MVFKKTDIKQFGDEFLFDYNISKNDVKHIFHENKFMHAE